MAVGLDRDDLDMVLDAIGQYARSHLPDAKLRELDAADEFPEAIVREMCGEGLGVSLLFISEEFGGMGGSAMDIYRVCEQLAAIDVGIATGVLATFLGSDPIMFGGTPEQQKRWMTRIANEGLLMAYGATEPEAGSDLAAMKTTAEPIVENDQVVGYVLNGNKQWISNGGYADVYTVLARAPGGPTWFVVERGTPGFTHGKPEDKHGIRASNTATLSLQDVRVEADAVVGGAEGLGLVQAQAVFGYTRLMVAAFGLGAGWAALGRAIEYSTQRVQAGGPLSEKEGYTHKLIVPHAGAARGRPVLHRGDRPPPRRRRAAAEHGGRHREVPRLGGRKLRRRRRHPGPWRLRVHEGVHGREDQARRAHHHDLRGHFRDHGDDDRPGSVAAAPQDTGELLPRPGRPDGGAGAAPTATLVPTLRPLPFMRSPRSSSRLASTSSPATSTCCSGSASSWPTPRARPLWPAGLRPPPPVRSCPRRSTAGSMPPRWLPSAGSSLVTRP